MRKTKIVPIIQITLFVIILLGVIFTLLAPQFNDTEYIITVTDKERIYTGGENGSSKYLVFGDDENGTALVFENTDTFIRGKWDSSNIQGQLKIGERYKITVIGYRIPFFSSYQNIIKVELVG